jgi:hypothetical protein
MYTHFHQEQKGTFVFQVVHGKMLFEVICCWYAVHGNMLFQIVQGKNQVEYDQFQVVQDNI